MANKNTAVMKAPSQDVLDALAQRFPVEEGFQSVPMARIKFVSQDVTEESGTGRNKQIKVVIPAGTFFLEKPKMDDDDKPVTDEAGKVEWETEEIGDAIDLHIFFQRKQLKYFQQETNSFVSSNIYDDNDEEVTLFANRTEIAKGLPADLKKDYESEDKRTGKVKSALEDNRVLYALYNGEPVQLNLRGTSMYAWMTFARTVRPSVPAVITHIESESKENGSLAWNQMVFTQLRNANADEANAAVEAIESMSEAIEARRARSQQRSETDRAFDEHQSSTGGGALPPARGR